MIDVMRCACELTKMYLGPDEYKAAFYPSIGNPIVEIIPTMGFPILVRCNKMQCFGYDNSVKNVT